MIWHLLGYLTLVSIVITTGGAGRYLWNAGREPRTWLQRVPVPRQVEAPLVLSSGADYVGWV